MSAVPASIKARESAKVQTSESGVPIFGSVAACAPRTSALLLATPAGVVVFPTFVGSTDAAAEVVVAAGAAAVVVVTRTEAVVVTAAELVVVTGADVVVTGADDVVGGVTARQSLA